MLQDISKKIIFQQTLINFEKMIGEIVDGIHSFPTHLRLDDQGMFALGFYHQNVELWKKSEKIENKEE